MTELALCGKKPVLPEGYKVEWPKVDDEDISAVRKVVVSGGVMRKVRKLIYLKKSLPLTMTLDTVWQFLMAPLLSRLHLKPWE